MKCIILEDNRLSLEAMVIIVKLWGHEVVGTYTSGEKLIESVDRTMVDFAILDIRVHGKIDGIEVARWLNEEMIIPIIYTTGFPDEENKIPANYPFYILTKPIDEVVLKDHIDFILLLLSRDKKSEMRTHSKNGRIIFCAISLLLKPKGLNPFYRVPAEDIIYVECRDHYLYIFTTLKPDAYVVHGTITDFDELTKENGFQFLARCHRKFIINVRFLKRIEFANRARMQILLKGVFRDGQFIPLGVEGQDYGSNPIQMLYVKDISIDVSEGFSGGLLDAFIKYG